jgi:hypothetical protein
MVKFAEPTVTNSLIFLSFNNFDRITPIVRMRDGVKRVVAKLQQWVHACCDAPRLSALGADHLG